MHKFEMARIPNPVLQPNAATYPTSYCVLLSSATTLFLRFLARMRIDFSLLYQRHNSRNNKTAHSTRTTNTSTTTTSCLMLTICQANENVTTPAKQATRMRFGAELFQTPTSPRKVQTQRGNNCGWDWDTVWCLLKLSKALLQRASDVTDVVTSRSSVAITWVFRPWQVQYCLYDTLYSMRHYLIRIALCYLHS